MSSQWPANPGGWSVATVIKWLLVVLSIPFFFDAYHGVVEQDVETGSLSKAGRDAVVYGLEMLGIALLMLVAAWAIWRFWEPNMD